MLLENSHFRPRGVLEWRKAGIELSTSSDEAAKLLDCLFYQLYSFSSDVSLGGLKGTMLRMRNADPDFILPQLFQYKLRIKGPSIHHEPFKVGLKDFKSALAQQTAFDSMPAGVRRWTDWERSHVQAAIAMAEGWTESAELAWEGLLKRAPQDLLSASSLFLSNLLSGQFTRLYANMDKAASGCRSSNPYYPYFLTRRAFGGCEIGAYAAAEQDCAEAFTICPSDPMGAHAMAHLYEYTYRPDLGAELFASQREGSMFGSRRTEWLSCGPLYACHIAWHESMFYSALGDWSKALEIWDANIWPHCVLYKEDCSKRRVGRFELSDTAGLLFRLDFEWGRGGMASQAQREILARWNLVADFLQDSEFGPEGIDEPLSLEPLYDILCTLTLLASSQVVQPTGRLADMVETHRVRVCKHLETLREAYAHLSSQPISNDKQRIGGATETDDMDFNVPKHHPLKVELRLLPIFLKIGQAYAEDDYATIVRELYPIKDELQSIGGSNAQRDLFNMFLFYGLAKSDSPLDKERLGQLLGQRQYNGTKSSIADRLMKRYLHQPRLEIVAS